MSEVAPSPGGRIVGVDAARALASLIMIQGHAYHAWVAEPYRESSSYQFTRLLGSLPLPAFLVLAGVGLGLRCRAARRRGEPASQVRSQLVRRGLQILAAGYATSFAFAVLDGGQGVATLLRADVLHVIGLSIALMAALGVGNDAAGGVRMGRLRLTALALWGVPTALCPWLSPLGSHVPEPLAPLAALLVDVPGYTRMPLVPLAAWLGAGVLLGTSEAVLPLGGRSSFARRAGASPYRCLTIVACAATSAWAASTATRLWVHASGEPLSRAHPAVLLNVVDLAARGALVLGLGLLLGGALPARAGHWVARLGQSSLWVYVAHLPFCYGRPGRPLWHALDMPAATLWLLPLVAGCVAVGLARSHFRAPRPAVDWSPSPGRPGLG